MLPIFSSMFSRKYRSMEATACWYVSFGSSIAMRLFRDVDLPRCDQITLEHAHVHQGRVRRSGPQVLAPEAHIVGGLILRGDAVRMHIRKRIRRRYADHHAGLAANVAGHPHVPRDRIEANLHPI